MPPINNNALSLHYEPVASLCGKEVYRIFLQNDDVTVVLTNLGCSILSIEAPDRAGMRKNIVAGFSHLEEYLSNRDYLGCVIGRYANRIANGRFTLLGEQFHLPLNDGAHHLHGGVEGFHQKVWDVGSWIREKERAGIVFSYTSKDGEEGYPGNLRVLVTCTLNKKNALCIEYEAETDRPTPVNLTNHSYFNLSGFDVPTVGAHWLQVNAAYYTEKNRQNVPTGSILPVANTALDFRTLKAIGNGMDYFPQDMGYDHNFVLADHPPDEVVIAARLYEPLSGRLLKVYTSQPGIQVYTANFWDGTIQGVQGRFYQKHGAVALETQAFPDSPNQPSFPNTILYPGELHRTTSIYAYGVVS